jgi:hypothetical protein
MLVTLLSRSAYQILYYKPHALHSGAPSSSLRHKGVVVVEQLEQTN